MNESITYAKKYLEDLLTFFGLNVDVQASHEDDVIDLSVPSTHLNGFLIGQRGETLRALQSLVSNALKNQNHELTRVNIDVADYKRHRQDRLAHQTEGWIQDIRSSQQTMVLQPMNAADRRIVHKVAADYSDISSESEGEGRDRHVVLKLVRNDAEDPEPEDNPVSPSEEPDTKEVGEEKSE